MIPGHSLIFMNMILRLMNGRKFLISVAEPGCGRYVFHWQIKDTSAPDLPVSDQI